MNIKQKIWIAAAASIVLTGGTLAIAAVFLHGLPLLLTLLMGAVATGLSLYFIISVHRDIRRGMGRVARIVDDMANGSAQAAADDMEADDEFGQLARSFRTLAVDLYDKTEQERVLRLEAEEEAWVNVHVSEMAVLLQGSVQLQSAARIFIGKLAAAVQASYGALYVQQHGALHFAGGYATDEAAGRGPFPLGVGLVGQCALDRQTVVIDDLPEGYVKIQSGLGEAPPASLLLVPVSYEDNVVAVLELASIRPLQPKERRLIERTAHNMGILINTLADIVRIEELLRETQLQKEELEAQTEELLAQTEELQAQSQELQAQTEDLFASNERLAQQMTLTENQKEEIEAQAEELKAQTIELQAQSEELAASNESLRQQVALTESQKDEIKRQADELLEQSEELAASNESLRQQMALTEEQKDEIKRQADELLEQSEELAASNESLRQQMALTESQKDEIQAQADELLAQSEELQAQTEELKAQTEELAISNDNLQQQMQLTERQKEEIKAQAEEIWMAAQYKSEFLANVSHELRTPLNSLLILSQILAENKEGNLHPKQLEYVHTIFSAGKDLLTLIDEILDLAKLEVGKMTAVIEPLYLPDFRDQLYRHFELLAQKKNIGFQIQADVRLPEFVLTDGHRLQQIMNNLLSNALKFTERGAVALSIRTVTTHGKDGAASEEIVFAVSDTGIGIPASKLDSIFDAFQQADGTTSRKYGGTGLGLTICRELATLLGGRIEVESTVGKGSTFALHMPVVLLEAGAPLVAAAALPMPSVDSTQREKDGFQESFVPDISISDPKLLQFSEMEDDRSQLSPGDTVLLIIEDDAQFASILLQLARRRGFKAIVAFQGDQGLALAHAYKPAAILLDLYLPVLDGWSIISRLKSRPELRHIPIHVISTTEENQQSLAMGALRFWKKPSDEAELEAAFLQIESYIRRPVKSLLIVEDNPDLRSSLVAFIAHPDVRIVAVGTGREALEQLVSHHFDCMVLDLGLADISGFDLLEQVKTNRKLQTLPVIIYTGKELNKQDEQRLKHYAESIVLKNVKSMERLYDDTALYLHRKHADLPADKQRLIEKLHNPEAAFEGKSILLVDDDMRNIFALSSVLEGYNMNISFAQNGKEALLLLENSPDVELVFMDIMMPEMDGYETIRRIRQTPQFDQLVIIALTARAMDEDRARCIEAGASDYISKPINTTQLVTVLKAWLIK